MLLLHWSGGISDFDRLAPILSLKTANYGRQQFLEKRKLFRANSGNALRWLFIISYPLALVNNWWINAQPCVYQMKCSVVFMKLGFCILLACFQQSLPMMRENSKELSKILGIGLLATQTKRKSFANDSRRISQIHKGHSCSWQLPGPQTLVYMLRGGRLT